MVESVEFVIRYEAEEVARVPGKVFYQSEDRFGLEFQFGNDEQRLKVQELLAHFLATV